MKRTDLAYRFREAFGYKTVGKSGERLEPINIMLAKLQEMGIPSRRIGYTSVGRTDGTFLKLHLKLLKGQQSGRVLYFSKEQKLVKDQ